MIANDKEKPDLIFGVATEEEVAKGLGDPLVRAKRYFKEGPLIPLSYYFEPGGVEMKERGAGVMRVMWDAYYATLRGK